MSLKSQPLLILKGMESKPLHGSYATRGVAEGTASIHEGLETNVVITFGDANRHLITLGATGSRKTTSVQAPAIVRLIETGCSGLVVDVKGEYRHLADEYPDRVLVIGADDDCTPYNLIEGMSDEQFDAFLNEHRANAKEPYWGAMGVQDARFVRKTYQLLGQEPTLADIVDALKEPQAFVRQCDAFVKFKRSLPKDYLNLLKAVRSNRFSILAMGESALLEIDAPGMEDVQKQYSWQTNGLISALTPFSVDPCLREKFSPTQEVEESLGRVGVPSMEDLLYRDRKVLLMDVPVDRFGKAAHVISKLMRIRMISAITGFRRHKQVGCGEDFYTFFAADEYQHLVNVDQEGNSSGLYDDTTFFDRCRGYGHINLIATQSVSALQARAPKEVAIDCLLQNIGTVIVFSSADPATDRLLTGRVSAMDSEQISSVVRSDLPAGQAYVVGRGLSRHGDATLVSRIRASAIPGAPHMSQYFTGMPDPIRIPAFSNEPDFVMNPFHDECAKPPVAGTHAMRRSFRERLENIIVRLAESQVAGDSLFEICDEILMEDADYRVALEGPLSGSVPTLWQSHLSLVIESQGIHGWRCNIPIATVMRKVEEVVTRAGRGSLNPKQSGLESEQTESSVKIFLPEEGEDISFSGTVTFASAGTSIEFPKDYWDLLCRCLGHLEIKYNAVTLEQHREDSAFQPSVDLLSDLFADE